MTRTPRRLGLVVATALALVAWRLTLYAAMTSQNLSIAGVTPAALAETLVGTGITFSNVTLTTPLDTKLSAGKFFNGKTIGGAKGLGFDTGVILSSGNIAIATAATNLAEAAGANLNGPGDPALTALLPPGSTTFDATVFEMDFVPDKDKVFIQYVFASEEYNEFVFDTRGFNDVFAFFVNGVNCATVGGQPVSINTINNGRPVGTLPNSHPEYFINNDFHSQNPPAPLATQMDGLTKVLTCKASVVANATNHLRIAIADAGDHSVDSVVFLNLDSFTTTPPVTITKRTNTTEYSYSEIGPYVLAGGPVQWSYTVTNTGTDTLTNVLVSDTDNQSHNIAVSCGGVTTLLPEQSLLCSATGTAIVGPYTNVSVVTAISPLVGEVTDNSPGHYFGADPKIRVITKTQDTDNPTLFAGEAVEWSYDVTNTGNVPLKNVTVTDSKGVTVNCGNPPETMWGVGQLRRCVAAGTVQPGNYSNTGRASGSVDTIDTTGATILVTRSDASDSSYFGADPKIALVKKTNGTNNDTAPGPLILFHDPVAATFEATNTGNVALANVTVADERLGSVCTIGSLAIGAGSTCDKASTAERDQQTATGTASGSYAGTFKTKTVTGTDPESYFGADPQITVVTRTNTTNNDVVPGPYVLVDDPVKWSYTVTVTGNVPLEQIAITDDQLGSVCEVGTLEQGASGSCDQLSSALKGQYTNLGGASGSVQTLKVDGTYKTVTRTSSDVDHYFGADPHVAIVTRTQGSNNDSPRGPLVLTGDPVKWTYAVTNTGNVPLLNVNVTDDQLGGICVLPISLPVGGADVDSCFRVSTAQKNQYTNVGTAAGSVITVGIDGTPRIVTRMATDADHYFGADPQISIITRTNTRDNDPANGPFILVGGAVKWTYLVSNTGNVPLADITVTDSPFGAICEIPSLDVDASDTSSCSQLSTAQKGPYTNTGTARGTIQTVTIDGTLKTVTPSDDEPDHYFGADPQIALLTKTNGTDNPAATGPFILVDDPVKWTYVVTNTGNVPLSNIAVTDNPFGAICTIDSLSAGETNVTTCTQLSTAQRDQHTNTGTATGGIDTVDVDGKVQTVTRTSSDIDHYFGAAPQLSVVTKTNGSDNNVVTGPFILVGDPVKSVYSVTNTGNVPIANVGIIDTPVGGTCTVGPLAIGATASCNHVSSALRDQRANLGAANGTINTVTVDGEIKLVNVTGSDPDHYFGADPAVSIIKTTNGTNNDTAPGALILVGDPVKWVYAVTNIGNVPLTNIVVTDDREGPICTVAALAVAQTVTCERLKSGDTFPHHDYPGGPGGPGGKDGHDDGYKKDDGRDKGSDGHDQGGFDRDKDYDDRNRGSDGRDNRKDDNGRGKNDDSRNFNDQKSAWQKSDGHGHDNDYDNDDHEHDRDCDHDHDHDYKPVKGAQKGQYQNTGIVRAQTRTVTIDGQFKIVTVTARNVDYYFGVDPKISLVKKTNGKNNDQKPGVGILVGKPVTWTYEVRNIGNVALPSVTVTDDKLGAITCPSGVLAVGATMVCTATGKATAGQYENLGTAVGGVTTQAVDGRLKLVTRTARDRDYYFGAGGHHYFVIGDKERHRVGDDVNFWGAQWWKNNAMSGHVSSGNPSFKGYATEVTLIGDGCGGTWVSRPGNSPRPPDSIPGYVTIIVTSDVVKNGSVLSGSIKEMVVVRQDGGYGPNPGHEGNGPVATTVCGGR